MSNKLQELLATDPESFQNIIKHQKEKDKYLPQMTYSEEKAIEKQRINNNTSSNGNQGVQNSHKKQKTVPNFYQNSSYMSEFGNTNKDLNSNAKLDVNTKYNSNTNSQVFLKNRSSVQINTPSQSKIKHFGQSPNSQVGGSTTYMSPKNEKEMSLTQKVSQIQIQKNKLNLQLERQKVKDQKEFLKKQQNILEKLEKQDQEGSQRQNTDNISKFRKQSTFMKSSSIFNGGQNNNLISRKQSMMGNSADDMPFYQKLLVKEKVAQKAWRFLENVNPSISQNGNSIFSNSVRNNNHNNSVYNNTQELNYSNSENSQLGQTGIKTHRQRKLKEVTEDEKRIFNETMNQIVVKEIFQTKEFKEKFHSSDFHQDKKIQEELMGTPGGVFDIQDRECHGNTSYAYYNTIKNIEKIEQKCELLKQIPNTKAKMVQNQLQNDFFPKTLGVFPKGNFGNENNNSNNFSFQQQQGLQHTQSNIFGNGNSNTNNNTDEVVEKSLPNLNFNISHYSLGKTEAKSFSNGLGHYKQIQKNRNQYSQINMISIQDNNFEEEVTEQILQNIPLNSKILDVSKNQIGLKCCEILNENFISQTSSRLKILQLEKCNLTDKHFQILIQSSDQQYRLKILNLNHNAIGEESADDFYEIMKFNSSLEEFYCNWNKLTGKVCHSIFQGLVNNNSIKVLDLSNNMMGDDSHPEAAKSIAEVLGNKVIKLMHIDLSRNKFSSKEAMIIQESYNQSENTNLMGFHFQGNSGYVVDPQGFLHKPENFSKTYNMQHKIHSLTLSGNVYKGDDLYKVDNCWVCEGWQQTTFVHKYSDYDQEGDLYIHLDFLNYQPLKMDPRINSIYFYKTLMVPPKRTVCYFFTIPSRNLQEINDQQQIQISCYNKIPQVFNYENGEQMEKQNLKYVNFFKSYQCRTIDDRHGIRLITCNLRNIQKKQSQFNDLDRQSSIVDGEDDKCHNNVIRSPAPSSKVDYNRSSLRDYRQLQNSIFGNLKIATQEDLLTLIHEDFKVIQLQKIITDEHDVRNTKLILTSNYQKLIDIYQYFSSKSPLQEIFTMSLDQYSNFLAMVGIADQFLKVSDCDMIYQYVKARHFKWKHGLTRFMFIEIIIRIVQAKYIQNGLETKFYEGLKHLLSSRMMNDLTKRIQHPQRWRERMVIETNLEKVVLKYWPVLKGLFDHYSSEKTLNGKLNQKTMTLSDFHNFIDELDEGDLYIPEVDIFLSFSYSSVSEQNDILGLKPKHLGIVEFVEAICRISEDYYKNPNTLSRRQSKELNEAKNNGQMGLALKLEGFIYYVYKQSSVLTEIIQENHSYISIYYNLFQKKGIARQSLVNIVLESLEKVTKRQDDDNRANKYQQLHKQGGLGIQGLFQRQQKKRSVLNTNFQAKNNENLLKRIIEHNLIQPKRAGFSTQQNTLINIRKRQNTHKKQTAVQAQNNNNNLEFRERHGSSTKSNKNTSGNLNLFFEHSQNNKVREKELQHQQNTRTKNSSRRKNSRLSQFPTDEIQGDEKDEFDIPDISSEDEDSSFEERNRHKSKYMRNSEAGQILRRANSFSSTESSVEYEKCKSSFQM